MSIIEYLNSNTQLSMHVIDMHLWSAIKTNNMHLQATERLMTVSCAYHRDTVAELVPYWDDKMVNCDQFSWKYYVSDIGSIRFEVRDAHYEICISLS